MQYCNGCRRLLVPEQDSRERDSRLFRLKATHAQTAQYPRTALDTARTIAAPQVPVVTTGRDLRLDLFRGIALWLIFLDHIPSNLVAWITIRNSRFSDATTLFVFVSGYTAAFCYGPRSR